MRIACGDGVRVWGPRPLRTGRVALQSGGAQEPFFEAASASSATSPRSANFELPDEMPASVTHLADPLRLCDVAATHVVGQS
jgi:hypothetical protein